MVSTAKIAHYLSGINFPASKQQMIDFAKGNDAPQDVLSMLQQIPDSTYYSMAGVWEAVGKAA